MSSHAVIAANLRAEMARQRKTGKELALVLSVSQASASRRTTGETPLDVDELCSVAAWLDVPFSALLPDRDSFKPAFMSPPYGVSSPAWALTADAEPMAQAS